MTVISKSVLLALIGATIGIYFLFRPMPPTPEQTWMAIPASRRTVTLAVYQNRQATLDQGYRATVAPDALPSRTIWLFGNSALWGLHVADADTIASQLQQLVGDQWRVRNRATSGAVIAGEYLELQDAPLRKGDSVVFYDGGWDAYKSSVDTWLQYDLLARLYTHEHGAAFYHVLQPVLVDPVNADELQLQANMRVWNDTPPGTDLWNQYRAVAEYDLTEPIRAFRKQNGWAFYDNIHTTPEANTIIARSIWRLIGDW